MSTHQCPGEGCTRQMSYHILACPAHWRMVPPAVQRKVYRTWKQGGVGDYMKAREEAISYMKPLGLARK